MKISGPQLRPLALVLLDLDKKGIIPHEINVMYDKRVFVRTSEGNGVEYVISESGKVKIDRF